MSSNVIETEIPVRASSDEKRADYRSCPTGSIRLRLSGNNIHALGDRLHDFTSTPAGARVADIMRMNGLHLTAMAGPA